MPDVEVTPHAWEAQGRPPTTDEQFALLETPARSPSEYRLPQGMLGDDLSAEALMHGDAVRSLLWSAGLPAHEGAALVQDIMDASRGPAVEMDDLTFEKQVMTTEATLRRQLGDAEYDRQRAALTSLLAEMDRKSGGKLGEFIEEHVDLLASPLVYARLMSHAGRVNGKPR